MLNSFGIDRLPETPKQDSDCARHPVVTDVTEVLVVRFFGESRPHVVLPRPRVFHKELPHLQHHGLDLVGYVPDGSAVPDLFLIEVMATVSGNHPPDVVAQKRDQLLRDTLDEQKHVRLMREFAWLHAESGETARDALNLLILELQAGRLGKSSRVFATPVLVSQAEKFDISDWTPFQAATERFEKASIPAAISFLALCPTCSFVDLVDGIKARIRGRTSPAKGGA